jgi:hypothetical protein
MKTTIAILSLLAFATLTRGQEVMTPLAFRSQPNSAGRAAEGTGSMWVSGGSASPLERDMPIRVFAEQGLMWRSLGTLDFGAFASGTTSFDTKGLDWNRFARGIVGLKATHVFRYGIVRFDVGYAGEHRFVSGITKAAPTASVSYWIGWQPLPWGKFPGSSWGIISRNVSPTETGNTLSMMRAEQGLRVVKIYRHSSIVTFGEITPSKDTKHLDWNNFVRYGGGIKLAVPTNSSILEVGATFLQERRFVDKRSGAGAAFFVRYWKGWRDR